MVTQLPENLVQLEGCRQRLDQRRRANRPVGQPDKLLRAHEDVVPEARLLMALHLGQVEVRSTAARDQLLRVVEEVQTEVEEAAGDRRPIDFHMLLDQMPAARAHEQRRNLLVEPVFLAVGVREANRRGERRRRG